jgi:hypothetical protein
MFACDFSIRDNATVADLNLPWMASNGHFSATGYVRNIGDNLYKTGDSASYSNRPTGLTFASGAALYDPRTYAIVLNAHF